jgi:hypothetical protein
LKPSTTSAANITSTATLVPSPTRYSSIGSRPSTAAAVDPPCREKPRVTPSATVEGPVHFRRGGRGACKELHAGAAPNSASVSRPVPRLARLMALALRCEELVHSGQVENLAELARLGHVSRARISQIMSLVQLAPDLQEELLFRSRPARGRDPWHLRLLLPITAVLCWRQQRRRWRELPTW